MIVLSGGKSKIRLLSFVGEIHRYNEKKKKKNRTKRTKSSTNTRRHYISISQLAIKSFALLRKDAIGLLKLLHVLAADS